MKFGKSNGSLVIIKEQEIIRYPQINDLLSVIRNRSILRKNKEELLIDFPKYQLPYLPSKIICLAKNYSAHAVEMGVQPVDLPKFPSLFLKPPSSVIGPGEKIVIPPHTNDVHHEVELAVIIGKSGRNIDRKSALNHVFGYTICLDITARDLQSEAKKKGRPWFVAKGFDTFCPIGPVVVSSDEIKDPHNLNINLKVNGELKQDGNTRDMLFKIDQIIEYCSSIVTLNEGDLIATGTPEGVAKFEKGDFLEASVDQIGTLEIDVEK
ncbi:MAG: fumarylacetoacetate hydrolase family protein [Candidatus Hodarchaeales archaeon]|jgi:2-keto-4-pentenoate hydratase/2-oxohepta-3-ene-1,7-dioic acid hydratase in catechol pathway